MIDAELQGERDALIIEHRELRIKYEHLRVPPFDRVAHLAHADRLHRHVARIRAYAEKLNESVRKARIGLTRR
jgi:hypothetical protein